MDRVAAAIVTDACGVPMFCIPANSSTCWTRKLQFADPTRNFLGSASAAGEQAPANPNQGYGFNARTFRLLAEDVASFYGATVTRPLFWDGFE